MKAIERAPRSSCITALLECRAFALPLTVAFSLISPCDCFGLERYRPRGCRGKRCATKIETPGVLHLYCLSYSTLPCYGGLRGGALLHSTIPCCSCMGGWLSSRLRRSPDNFIGVHIKISYSRVSCQPVSCRVEPFTDVEWKCRQKWKSYQTRDPEG